MMMLSMSNGSRDAVLKSKLFKKHFTLDGDWKKTRVFTEADVNLWIGKCNEKQAPPYKVLAEWLKRNNGFGKKKITKVIRSIGDATDAKKKNTFHWFCRSIAERDSSCFV